MHSLGMFSPGVVQISLRSSERRTRAAFPMRVLPIVISNQAPMRRASNGQHVSLNALVIPSKGKVREAHDAGVSGRPTERLTLSVLPDTSRLLLSGHFRAAFPQRILNIHPSLLPAFPGLDAQRAGLRAWRKNFWMYR